MSSVSSRIFSICAIFRRVLIILMTLPILFQSAGLPAQDEGAGKPDSQPADAGQVETNTRLTPEQKKANITALRNTIRSRIIALIDDGGSCTVQLEMFGRMADVEVDGASEDGLEATYDGEPVDIDWSDVSDNTLGKLLLTLAGDAGTPADILRAGLLIRVGGDEDAGNRLIYRAFRSVPQTDENKEQIAILNEIRDGILEKRKTFTIPDAPVDTPRNAARHGKPVSAWTPQGLCGGGAMYCISVSPVDPDRMMVNSDMSGQYISFDAGKSWRMIPTTRLRSNIECTPAFHPVNPDIIYAADSRLKISRDAGETWTPVGSNLGRPNGPIGIDPDKPDFMVIGAEQGICVSHNAGKQWDVASGLDGQLIGFHFDRTSPKERRTLFVATSRGIWRSDDEGKSWKKKTKGLPSREILSFDGGSRIVGKRTKEIILYCAVATRVENGALTGGVYVSFDRGETWKSAMGKGINTTTARKNSYALSDYPRYTQVAVADADPRIVYTFCVGNGFYPPLNTTVFKSTDAGEKWKATFFGDPRFKGKRNLSPTYRTVRVGQYYQSTATGMTVCNTDLNRIAFVTDDYLEASMDGGASWYPAYSIPKPGQDKPGYDTDWICNGLVVTSCWNYYVDPHDPKNHYICYTDIGFAASRDGGQSWRWYDPDKKWSPWQNTTYELAIDPDIPGKIWGAFSTVHDIPNGNIIYGRHNANGQGGVCLSTDFAKTFTVSNKGLPLAPCLSVILDPTSPKGNRTLYASMWEKGVYKSVDDGKTWTRKSAGLGDPKNMRVCRLIRHKDGTLFVLITAKMAGGAYIPQGCGLYRSRDESESWEKITPGGKFLWPKDYGVDPDNSNIIFLGNCRTSDKAEDGGLFKTEDGGKNWKFVIKKGSQHFGAYFHPNRKGWIYMTVCESAWGAPLWLSKNGGANWEPFSAFPFSNAQRVTVDPANDDKIYVTTFGGSVWVGPAEPVKTSTQP